MEEKQKTLSALERAFRGYYYRALETIRSPSRIEEREFGYMTFEGVMIRHLSMKNEGELKALLLKEAPYGVYYSCGYYFEPSFPMHEKGWKGADIIFDIDADALGLPCKGEHDEWTCKKCGFSGKGRKPSACPKCGETRLKELNWSCKKCLEGAKDEAIKLMDFLEKDFGIPAKSIKTCFSGNMGYHLSLEHEELVELDQGSRKEIADYLMGLGFLPERMGISKGMRYDELYSRLPEPGDPGWRGRLAEYLTKMEIEGYEGDNPREKILHIYSRLGYSKFKEQLDSAIREISVTIDTTVTTDIHKVFRLPLTLNGKTGMAKVPCRDILSFDPLEEAVVMGEEPVKIFVEHSPQFFLKGRTFGPYKKEEIVLPEFGAVYLMSKGLAIPLS